LANHKSALKRARQNEIRRIRNKSYRTSAKKAVRGVRTAMANESVDQARKDLTHAVSVVQKTVSKGVIHRNKAARIISRLSTQVNSLAANSS